MLKAFTSLTLTSLKDINQYISIIPNWCGEIMLENEFPTQKNLLVEI